MTRKNKIILLILIVSLCYINTLRNGFVWDDNQFIVNNEQITSLKNIPSLLVPLKTEPYRPMRLLTFSVEHAVFGLNSTIYHLDNAIIHTANAVLLFVILLLMFRDEDLAFYSALIFGIYPAWNEAIVWIKNRSMLLAGLFLLLGLYFYIKKKNPLAIIAFVLGLLSKEILIAFPFILTAYSFIFERERKKTDLIAFWVIGIAWVIFLFMRHGGQVGAYAPGEGFFFSLKIMFRFFLILLFPFRLNAERVISFPETIFDGEVIISFIMTVLVLVWLYKNKFKNKALSFFLLWMIFNIFPTANPGLVAGRPLAEHRLYILGMGFSVLIFMVLRSKKKLLYVLMPVFFITSFARNLDWKDEYTFWSQTVKVSSSSARAYSNLALAGKSRLSRDKTERYFKKAIELEPGHINAIGGLFNIFIEKGKNKEAESLLLETLKKYPGEINLYKDLINLYMSQKRKKEAQVLCRDAAYLIGINLGNIEDYLPIGVQAFQLGLMDDAEKIFKKVSREKPWSGYVLNNLASVYHAKKNYLEAEKYYKQAIEKQLSNPAYYYNLGNLYYAMNEKDKAISNYERAIDFEENYADAWHNLGLVYKEKGSVMQADLCFRKVRIIEREILLSSKNKGK